MKKIVFKFIAFIVIAITLTFLIVRMKYKIVEGYGGGGGHGGGGYGGGGHGMGGHGMGGHGMGGHGMGMGGYGRHGMGGHGMGGHGMGGYGRGGYGRGGYGRGGYGQGAVYYDYPWYYPWFLVGDGYCKTGCGYVGNGQVGCVNPGYGYDSCQFATDCTGC